MRFTSYTIAFLLLFLAAGCVPSKTLVSTDQEESIMQVNDELKNKIVEIRLKNGEERRAKNVRVTSDSLLYTESYNKKALQLNVIKRFTASPKVGVSEIIGLPLFALGIYGLTSFDARGDLYKQMNIYYSSIAAIVLSGFTLIDGKNKESETYYFDNSIFRD
jgi:hypothetical protein